MIKWAYVLIGDNNTGKTTFQKEIIKCINFIEYQKLAKKLPRNIIIPVIIRIGNNNTKEIFFMNRSYQENVNEYKTIQNFFKSKFKEADACILSSHLDIKEIKQMIIELKKRFYNVCGVFFENSIAKNKSVNENIALLEWDERYLIENKVVECEEWKLNLENKAIEFSNHILCKI